LSTPTSKSRLDLPTQAQSAFSHISSLPGHLVHILHGAEKAPLNKKLVSVNAQHSDELCSFPCIRFSEPTPHESGASFTQNAEVVSQVSGPYISLVQVPGVLSMSLLGKAERELLQLTEHARLAPHPAATRQNSSALLAARSAE
jgi:hypothetical protein